MTITQNAPAVSPPGTPAPTAQPAATPHTGRRTVAGRSKAGAGNRQTKDFLELSRQVKDAGLMETGAASYLGRAAVLVAGFAAAGALLATLGESMWQLAVAALFGVLFTQVAFLSHDAAHQQIFSTGTRNEWTARIVGNLVVGLSYGWWTHKHSKHHVHPNTIGKDGDIEAGALVFVPEDAAKRTGFMRWLGRRQGWFFFPLLTLFGLVLHYKAAETILRADKLKHRGAEAALLAVRVIGFPALVIWLLGPWLGLGFLAVQLAVFGVYMGASFAPNHKGMPLIPAGVKVDFLQRQVLTSRNIRGGRLTDWAMGGLNYQIEHHIFPRMPSPNLHKVQPMVRRFCAERGIPYTEAGLVESYGIVISYLNRVGLGKGGNPMECPLISQFRAR
ncbi:acyl-CoA desaturase [Nesterenkonia sp.]|uniref:fatty acid desaturase family protein n=1 Tax=Nesterenkonia sp. TaxID=704201 RepID=UPI00261C9A4B|nr:acyl-CoA desaturase [Nesterenkonia sp.]